MVIATYEEDPIEIADGKIATFKCAGKVMTSDIGIDGSSAFVIVGYNGNETRIEEKRAKLPCAGKFMKSDVTIDTTQSAILIYAEDDTTMMDGYIVTGNTTITVVSLENDSKQVKLKFARSDGTEFTETFGYTGTLLTGVTDDIAYYRAKYETGDSFTLGSGKIHRIYLRAMKLYAHQGVWIFGLEYVDGQDFRRKDGYTWADWVNDTADCNKIGAQIINGNIYTSDGAKILHNPDGTLANASDVIIELGEYTFTDV